MPWWFIIYLILFIITLISASFRRLPKFRKRVISMSQDKRDKLIHSYAGIIKICKIMFIMTPVYLFIMPYLLYHYCSFQLFFYGTAMLILMYLMLLEDFIFKKSILKKYTIGKQKKNIPSPNPFNLVNSQQAALPAGWPGPRIWADPSPAVLRSAHHFRSTALPSAAAQGLLGLGTSA
jgi:hypothetical protein